MATPDQDAIREGRDFEAYVAQEFGGDCVPNSGTRWFSRLDVVRAGLRVSCKCEKGLAWSKIKRYLGEAIEGTFGSGQLPALVLRDKDDYDDVVLMRLADFKQLLTELDAVKMPESKGAARRRRAGTPVLLRDE